MIVAETVFVSAVLELSVPVATPLEFVVPDGCVRLLPVVGFAARTTVAAGITLPNWSDAVTVISEAVPAPVLQPLLHDVMVVGAAVTVDWPAETAAGLTLTVAVWVIDTVLIVAEMIFVSATVEDNVHVATPLPFVVAVRLTGLVVLPDPEMARVTLAPAIVLFVPSRAVTLMVDVLDPELAVMVVGDAETVEFEAETVPAVTVTVAVCVMAVPLAVAETTLSPVAVELSMPVATPVASVGPLACVSVLPAPVAASTTMAPWIGLPN